VHHGFRQKSGTQCQVSGQLISIACNCLTESYQVNEFLTWISEKQTRLVYRSNFYAPKGYDFHKPLAGWQMVVKTLEDRILALLLLMLVAPTMGLIALAIKLDSNGPILSRQRRYGFNHKPFSFFRFRTMYHHRPLAAGAPEVRHNDSGVTRVGRFLRRTSLDELPQLFNVLQGVMSLVGSRPQPIPPGARFDMDLDDTPDQDRATPESFPDGRRVATLRGDIGRKAET